MFVLWTGDTCGECSSLQYPDVFQSQARNTGLFNNVTTVQVWFNNAPVGDTLEQYNVVGQGEGVVNASHYITFLK